MSLLGLLCGSLAFGQGKIDPTLVGDVRTDEFSYIRMGSSTLHYTNEVPTNRMYLSAQHAFDSIDSSFVQTSNELAALGSALSSTIDGVNSNLMIVSNDFELLSVWANGGCHTDIVTGDSVCYLTEHPGGVTMPTNLAAVPAINYNFGLTATNFAVMNDNTYLTTNLFLMLLNQVLNISETNENYDDWVDYVSLFQLVGTNYVSVGDLPEFTFPSAIDPVYDYVNGFFLNTNNWAGLLAAIDTNFSSISTEWTNLTSAVNSNAALSSYNAQAHNYNFANPTGAFVSSLWTLYEGSPRIIGGTTSGTWSNRAEFATAVSNAIWLADTNFTSLAGFPTFVSIAEYGDSVFNQGYSVMTNTISNALAGFTVDTNSFADFLDGLDFNFDSAAEGIGDNYTNILNVAGAHDYNFLDPNGFIVNAFWSFISGSLKDDGTGTNYWTDKNEFAAMVSNGVVRATDYVGGPSGALSNLVSFADFGDSIFIRASNYVVSTQYISYVSTNLSTALEDRFIGIASNAFVLEDYINGVTNGTPDYPPEWFTNLYPSFQAHYTDAEPYALQPLVNSNFAVVEDNFTRANTNTLVTVQLLSGIMEALGLTATSSVPGVQAAYSNLTTVMEDGYTNLGGDLLDLGSVSSLGLTNILEKFPTNIVGASDQGNGTWLLDSYNTNIYMLSIFVDGNGNDDRKILATNTVYGGTNVGTVAGFILTNYYDTSDIGDPGGWYNATNCTFSPPKDGVYNTIFSAVVVSYAGTTSFSPVLYRSESHNDGDGVGWYTLGLLPGPNPEGSDSALVNWSYSSAMYTDEVYSVAGLLASAHELGDPTNYVDWAHFIIQYVGPAAGVGTVTEELP